jgi:hypothetical protein
MIAMSDNFVFRDVWQQSDARAEADVIALWQRLDILPAGVNPQSRAKELCVAAYDGDRLAAVTTATVDTLQVVRTRMLFLRALVAPEYRSKKVVVPLTLETHEALSRYALAHPDQRLGGTVAVVTSRPGIYKPIGSAHMVLIGYTARNEPVTLRWFDHHRL